MKQFVMTKEVALLIFFTYGYPFLCSIAMPSKTTWAAFVVSTSAIITVMTIVDLCIASSTNNIFKTLFVMYKMAFVSSNDVVDHGYYGPYTSVFKCGNGGRFVIVDSNHFSYFDDKTLVKIEFRYMHSIIVEIPRRIAFYKLQKEFMILKIKNKEFTDDELYGNETVL